MRKEFSEDGPLARRDRPKQGVVQVTTFRYGVSGEFQCAAAHGDGPAMYPAPAPLTDVAAATRAALAAPLDFPPLARAVVPGDKVVLALDRHTPEAAILLQEIWRVLDQAGVVPSDVLILQPAAIGGTALEDPRRFLPVAVQSEIAWAVHDATDQKRQAYLATTSNGERLYLARELIEADLVIPIGQIAFDPVLGHRGTGSVFYPGLATTDAFLKARGQGHFEIGPDEVRPLRQLIDEVTWLLGVQFSVQTIAAGGAGILAVLAGLDEAVFRRGKDLLAQYWTVELPERPQVVVMAIEQDAAGHGWKQIGAALESARNLVCRGGKVVLLSEVQAELDKGLELIRESINPREALRPIRELSPPDLIPATQLASGADWADVYLLSRMDHEIVEDLFMIPLGSAADANRLLATTDSGIVLGGGQHIYACVKD